MYVCMHVRSVDPGVASVSDIAENQFKDASKIIFG